MLREAGCRLALGDRRFSSMCARSASSGINVAGLACLPGPKLFKEPSSKSNKPIIHNAISHCCLAGKVNEPHKNSILEASVKRQH